MPSALDRPAWTWRELVVVGGGSLLLGMLFGYPALADLRALGAGGDWDQHLFFHWVPYETVTRFGQLPLWNPWACGGTPMLANPQARFLSPFFLLHLGAGPVVALHLEIVLHLALAAAGGYYLGRELKLGLVARAAVALVFLGTSAHSLHLAMGHTWALSYAWFPWVLALASRALATSRLTPAIAAGGLLALIVYEGGIYPAPQAALLLALLCLGDAVRARRLFPLGAAAVSAAVAAGLSAPKLLPTLALMWQHPRRTEALESMDWGLLLDALFSRDQTLGRAVAPQQGLTWGFHEYGAYLGPAAALLVVAGLVLARRRSLAFAALGAVFLVLALGRIPLAGGEGSLGLWPLLHELPVFGSQHVPSRFLVPFILCAAVVAGLGADALARRWPRWGAVAAAAMVAVGAIDAWRVGPPNLWRLYDAPQGPAGAPGPFR
ncbi:MAG: hypothetical protein HY901_14520, partial [Deltaproteobacteria bacterium]|nr:hypothetical protein [Deltaproteobacteria bacterium]